MPASARPLRPLLLAPFDLADCTLFTFPAEIDLSNASDLLDEALALAADRAGRTRTFVLDLTRTRFLDSQGVRLLLELRRELRRRHDAEARVVALDDGPVHRVLALTQARRDIPVHDRLVDALEAG
ncbi:STAS domain-containing protein [Streptomyces sp. NPDC050095]|uniref:STAS domain-containing protein n=1 Tax=unclassified Streptomyces TaxID=2593676 RepID=UPI00343B2B21